MGDKKMEEKERRMQKYFTLLKVLGADDARLIDPATVATAPWPAFKCQYGCAEYGKSFCCPPHTPDYRQMRAIIDCYDTAILFHFRRMGNLTEAAQKTARQMFLDGYYKAIALGSGPCRLCKKCALVSGGDCEAPGEELGHDCEVPGEELGHDCEVPGEELGHDCEAPGELRNARETSDETGYAWKGTKGYGGGAPKAACRFPEKAIPAMEACGIDVYATVRANACEIATLSDKDESKNFYGLLLVE